MRLYKALSGIMRLSKALEGLLCRRLHKALYKMVMGDIRLYKALQGSMRDSISDYEILSGPGADFFWFRPKLWFSHCFPKVFESILLGMLKPIWK